MKLSKLGRFYPTLILLLLISLKLEAQDSSFKFIDSLLQKGRCQLALQELNKVQPPTFLVNYKKEGIYSFIDNHKKAILKLAFDG